MMTALVKIENMQGPPYVVFVVGGSLVHGQRRLEPGQSAQFHVWDGTELTVKENGEEVERK
jgi:hypothetical protein